LILSRVLFVLAAVPVGTAGAKPEVRGIVSIDTIDRYSQISFDSL
jgi:hypothetical protein